MFPSDLLQRLPTHLSERVHALPGPTGFSPPATSALGGDYVLYWMRTAVRGHENPALDAALALSTLLRRPLFVYHALSERIPYAADRHHQFILEGARDVQAELGARNIGYAFHLERPGHRGPHLRTLAARAVIVVTEDMPWSPLVSWTRALASSLSVPVWAVDTACVLPTRSLGRAWQRAFSFRGATATQRLARALQPWTEQTPAYPAFVPALPFAPVDLACADLPSLIAECQIDHAIAPVPHTRGGSQAGYDRWARFLAHDLGTYATRGDDPLANASSRLSAYLHYGHVSPLRIARQAATAPIDRESRDKFLDELLTWRELAHNFCTFEPAHETLLGGIPAWARKTLQEHEGDHRDAVYSWERLARGQTSSPLWNAAQQSLLIHGELHNNVRMTWGKALLGWTPDAQTALRLLIDLNHRYALDGRDPSSYGGILWCLGQFDRPFPPRRPILGLVRARSLAVQARKLPVAEYAAHTSRPAHPSPRRVAIVGAGPAALFCARILADHSFPVRLFHAAPTPTDSADAAQPQAVLLDDARLVPYATSWVADRLLPAEVSTPPGAPGCDLRPLLRHLASGLPISDSLRVARISREGAGHRVHGHKAHGQTALYADDLGLFDTVIVATRPDEVPDTLPPLTAASHVAGCTAVIHSNPTGCVLRYDDSDRGATSLQGALLSAMALAGRALST